MKRRLEQLVDYVKTGLPITDQRLVGLGVEAGLRKSLQEPPPQPRHVAEVRELYVNFMCLAMGFHCNSIGPRLGPELSDGFDSTSLGP